MKELSRVKASFTVVCFSIAGQFLATESASAAILEEVVVTAQKRAESVNDVPITISAFSGDQLKELGVIDTRDLGKIVPGFQYSDTGLNTPVFTLRGIGFNDFSATASGTVGIYVGEFNLPYPVMGKGPNVDIERIEVLKGPQGTLYGRNTTAGVVNFIPAKPTDYFAAAVTASYGRFETWDTEAFVSGPVTDTVGMRLAARKITTGEDWQYSLTRPEDTLGKQDKWSARYTMDWAATDMVNIELVVDYWEDDGDPQGAQPVGLSAQNPFVGSAGLDPRVRNHPLLPLDTDDIRVADWPSAQEWGVDWHNNDTFSMGKLRVDWDLNDEATLSYLLSYADFLTDWATFPTTGLSVLNAEGLVYVHTTAWTRELRIAGTFGDDWNYIFGTFDSKDSVYNYWGGYTATISSLFPSLTQNPFVYGFIVSQFPQLAGQQLSGNLVADRADSEVQQDSKTNAVFFDLTWRFIPDFSLIFGARYTDESRDFEGCTRDNAEASGIGFATLLNLVSVLQGGDGGAPRGGCITLDHETRTPGLVEQELDEDNVSGRVVLNWTPTDDWMFYLSRSRGFKTGSFPIAQASDSEQFRPVTQERLDSWEVGGKMSLLDQSMQLNFALFDYDYRDKQLLGYVYDQVFGALLQLANAPESKVQGAELDIRARATESLDVFVAAAYIDTEILEYEAVNQKGIIEDNSGSELNNAPDLTGTIGLRYTWDVSWSEAYDVVFGADYSYTGETSAVLNDDPYYRIDDYYNINAQVGLVSVDGIWKVTAWGRNITNEYQPISVGSTFTDAIQRYVKPPQSYGLTVEYRFGE